MLKPLHGRLSLTQTFSSGSGSSSELRALRRMVSSHRVTRALAIITRRGMEVGERKFIVRASMDPDFPRYKDFSVCGLGESSQQHGRRDH